MASSMNIVKAGELLRQSTILRRWKPAWLVLYDNGFLHYFENKDSLCSKASICLLSECLDISPATNSVDVPKSKTKDCIIRLITTSDDWYFCADSSDDAVAWKMAISEFLNLSRRFHTMPIPRSQYETGYTDGMNYYQHGAPAETTVPLYRASAPSNNRIPIVYRGSDGRYVIPERIIEHPDGTRTIVMGSGNEIHCHCRHGYYCGCRSNYADAALFGLAAGSLMWTPFLWSPLFWC